jgi:ABC-2 type transport system permease protein/lipopolysaccharide transport system permease protein
MNSSSPPRSAAAAAVPGATVVPGFETGGPATTRDALTDIGGAVGRWELWLNMAWQDIRQRYRGSMLGPFWVTINMGLMVALLAYIYGRLLGAAIREYLPFLTLGFLVWRWVELSVNESTLVFIVANRYIKQIRLPVCLFVFRLLSRNLIVFAHNFLVYVVVAAIVGLNPGWVALLAVPGLLLGTVCLFWITLLFGMLSARFRDFPQIITSLMPIVFYVTPILWEPRLIGARRFVLVDYNPVYYFIEIIRAPLMGHAPPVGFWKVTVIITLALTAIAFPIFRRFRGRLAYWV